MNNIKFSILIPVYNVEKYLGQCIDSILGQDYDNLEIILVNDGSTDGSGIICDEYAKKDSRIRVIHKVNEGVYVARRIAIDNASGDYCIFVDSDDYWDYGLLNCISDTIKEHGCDMVLYNFRNIYPDEIRDTVPLFPSTTIFEGDKKKEIYTFLLEGDWLGNLVLKAVSMEIIKADPFRADYYGIKKGEDALQGTSFLISAKKIVYIPKTFYNYRRGVGVTRQIKADDVESITRARKSMVELLKAVNMDLTSSFSKNYDVYMECIPKHIVYGYIDNKVKIKRIFKEITKTGYYNDAKTNSYSKLPVIKKIIIFLAENDVYSVIWLFSLVIRVRKFLRNLHI